jgi:hypothetical protein
LRRLREASSALDLLGSGLRVLNEDLLALQVYTGLDECSFATCRGSIGPCIRHFGDDLPFAKLLLQLCERLIFYAQNALGLLEAASLCRSRLLSGRGLHRIGIRHRRRIVDDHGRGGLDLRRNEPQARLLHVGLLPLGRLANGFLGRFCRADAAERTRVRHDQRRAFA